jgi:hypothetical protein
MTIDILIFEFKDVNQVLNDLEKIEQTINYTNNEAIWLFYKGLIRLRHDFLHFLVLKSIGKLWSPEKTITELFELNSDNKILNRTPDIYIEKNRKHYLIDVSVSNDTAKSELLKSEKYSPVIDFLKNMKYDVEFIHLNISSTLKNLELEIGKINFLMIQDFYTLDYIRFWNKLQFLVEKINDNIEQLYFDEKKKEFSGKIDLKNEDDLLFLDELTYTNMGKWSNLSVDLEMCKKYNSEFERKKINIDLDSIDNFDESRFIEDLKEIIENPKKNGVDNYKDIKLEVNNFIEAKDEILNECKKKKILLKPKPTHHMMVPVYFEEHINFNDNMKINDQKDMYDFMKNFLVSTKELEYTKLNEKLVFLKELFQDTLFCLDEDLDNEIEKDLFYSGYNKFEKFKREYDELKNISIFVQGYESKNKYKPDANLLIKLNSTLNANNYEDVRKQYNIYKEQLTNLNFDLKKNFSFRDFLRFKGEIRKDDNKTYIKSKSTVRLGNQLSDVSKQYISKNGIGADKLKKNYNPDSKEYFSLNLSENYAIDNYIKIMLEENKSVEHNDYSEVKFLNTTSKIDSIINTTIKNESLSEINIFYKLLTDKRIYHYSRLTHILYTELFHVVQKNEKMNTYSFLTGGLKNFLVIIANTWNQNTNEIGKPFMSVIKTKKPEFYESGFFGKTYKYKINAEEYIVCTNWRRLTLTKITFIKDCFFSTLSSTMNSAMSSPLPSLFDKDDRLVKIFILRNLFGVCTKQKSCEFLMDTRYAYMSAFSIYTNITKLLFEKFGPPYSTNLECWIANKLLTRLPIIHEESMNGNITMEKIMMDRDQRSIETIGGNISLSSLWFDYKNRDILELLDEVFVYCHTIKEPSNIYHENVKAMRTIQKFQSMFDKLREDYPEICIGNVKYKEDILGLLRNSQYIGFSSSIIKRSVSHTLNKDKPNLKKIIHKINDESIGEILSTKAVISDIDRFIVKEEKISKKRINKEIKREKDIIGRELTSREKTIVTTRLVTHSKFYHKHKPRQRVMETILEQIEENPNKLNRVIDLANLHLEKENCRVLADICIKSQYGSKREFYVINIGAKAHARIVENFFKEVCKQCPNEAISIPGEEKVIRLQSMMDKIYHNIKTKKQKIMYINGDCTKWSAAETMGSFLAMMEGFKEFISLETYEFIKTCFNSWSNKDIQIPMDIYKKVIGLEKYKTDFLLTEDSIEKAKIHSTQNFLQGMFNYSSSYKAVCCNNYMNYIWKKMYPDSNLNSEHMEHSDDYVNIVLYENDEEFERYRLLQKIIMRLHGYNDSERKTSCQPFFLEFVSLLSFNGVMLYPQIKKTKEVNLSLPCTGYKTDMEAALSRVKECARVGCNQSFLYFFQKMHVYLVCKAYGLLENMTNSFNLTIKDKMEIPIELFGIPDPLPLYSLYCRGNANNYRLWTYGNFKTKSIMVYLYKKSLECLDTDYSVDDFEYNYSLHYPRYTYKMNNKSIIKLRRNLGFEMNDVFLFWEEHISYHFVKPRHLPYLAKWIKSMFFNRVFIEAYSKSGRPQMTMRLSGYVKNAILRDVITVKDIATPENIMRIKSQTINEYFNKHYNIAISMSEKSHNNFMKNNNDVLQLYKIITKCDPSYSAIDSIIKNFKIISYGIYKEKTVQISLKTPYKIQVMPIKNSPTILMQYLFNKEDLKLDKRALVSRISLEHDIKTINDRIPKKMLNNKNPLNVLSIYNDLMINFEKRIVTFGYNRHAFNLFDHIHDILTNNYIPGRKISIKLHDVVVINDPFTGKPLYTKGIKVTPDFHKQCAETICLLFVFFL